MVNHISAKSPYFQDFLKKGRKSEYADMFITVDKIWPDGNPPPDEVEKIFLRRTEPFSDFTIEETGEIEKVWTTFGKVTPSEQIDLDVNSEATRQLFANFLTNFSENMVKIVRLDAVGYVVKKLGTTCFFVEPEIFQFLDWITELANSLEIELLPEVHAHYSTQYKLIERGHWTYDFILPYTILDALINKTSVRLCRYLENRPHKQFTMLDCHDGVPVKPDLNDLYKSENVRKLVDICLERGANLSLIFSPKHRDPDGFDVHQIRGTYYSMLDSDNDAYLAARAIQFFTPGIPQVYYVGLLAGENDKEGVKKSGEGRDINRHNFSMDEIDQAVNKDVVQRLLKLIRFRNDCPAFSGDFKVVDSKQDEVCLSWMKESKTCTLKIDLENYQSVIEYVDDRGKAIRYLV
jgi:sucrose phosphorylase